MIWISDRPCQELVKGDIRMQAAHRHHRGDGDDRGDDREESRHRCWEPMYQQLSDRDGNVRDTHKESNAHVLVIEHILSMSLKLLISTSLILSG